MIRKIREEIDLEGSVWEEPKRIRLEREAPVWKKAIRGHVWHRGRTERRLWPEQR